MTDANGAPRRVSMAYILGFSDKPYKEVKPPMSTPGRIVEWTASDGRKGRLTGTGKPRLTAASLSKVPSEQRPAKELPGAKGTPKKAASTKVATDGDNLWGNNDWGNTNAKSESKKSSSKKTSSSKGDACVVQELGNDASDPFAATWGTTPDATGDDDNKEKKDEPTALWEAMTVPENNTVPEDNDKKDGDSNGWTKEQDEKPILMKTETSKTWAQMGEEIGGKTKQDCQDRFKDIQPEGYKANEVNKGGGGKKGKKGKNADQNDGKNKKDEKKEKEKEKEREKKEEAAGEVEAWETQGGWGPGANTSGGDGANDAAPGWDNFGGNSWNTDTNNNQNNNIGGGVGGDQWTASAPAQKAPSNKAPPQAPSKPNANNKKNNSNNTHLITACPLELEAKPDDTFSADDLRLVARILQQDCSTVWNRVSWRFRDKTGRTIHPDEFEKKITGRLEGKGSEKAERRR
ncbi:hypothetical protein J4E91_003590 [Alternaria rosae]|nr:hypothetical protein J4E91_003590 [Alternaria rosae]